MSTTKSTIASARPAPSAEPCPAGVAEAGTGLVSAIVGLAIFLVLLLFAVQVLVRLYATSTLTATGFDAARQVASAPGAPSAAIPLAEATARHRLGRFASDHTTFIWQEADDQQVVLKLDSSSPGFLPLPRSFREIHRTVTVRRERFR